MNTFSLSAPMALLQATDMSFGERVTYAGTLTLLGMLIIFSVLSIVWGAISLMRMILIRLEQPTARKMTKQVIQTPPPEAPVSEQPAAAPAASTDEGALLAAITAAIAVVWESEHPNTGFRVVSYRHMEKRSPWNRK